MSLIEVSAWSGVLAALLLVYRITSSWRVTSALTKAVAITLLAVILGQAFGSSRTISGGGHLDLPTVRVIFSCRLIVIALCLAWPWRE